MDARARFSVALVVLMASFALAACGETPTAPSNYTSYKQVDLIVGTGTEAVSGNAVTVDYTGWFYVESAPDQKGPMFDTSKGTASFTFTIGAGTVIKGWDQGVTGMRVGGTRRLVIPPSLGYGVKRYGSIPPNSTLVFEITLRGVTQ